MADQITKIIVIGCGPGSNDYLTPAAIQAVNSVEVLVGARRLLELFPDFRGRTIELNTNVTRTLDKIGQLNAARIGVLVTGDPGLFSLAKLVIKKYGVKNCRVIPGISSVQAAFASIGLDWQDTVIISAHKIDPYIPPHTWNAAKVAVLGGRDGFNEWLFNNIPKTEAVRQIVVCENLTLINEKITRIAYEDLKSMKIDSRAVVLLVRS